MHGSMNRWTYGWAGPPWLKTETDPKYKWTVWMNGWIYRFAIDGHVGHCR